MRDDTPVGLAIIAHTVRQLRTKTGMTQDQLGRQLDYTRSAVSNIENAIEMPSRDVLVGLDATFGTDGLLVGMRDQALRDGLPSWATERIEYESHAIDVVSFEPIIFDGYVQTSDYTRSLLAGGLPGDVADDVFEVEMERRARQQELIVSSGPQKYHLVLGEAALHNVVGSNEVMADQLSHVAHLIRRRQVTIQVLPRVAAASSLPAPLTLMTLNDGTEVVYREMGVGGQTTTDPSIVRQCKNRFDMLRSQAASLDMSARMIEARLEEL